VIAARSVEGDENPEDGTGEGLATLARHGGGSAAAMANGAPDVVVFEGERNPGEADPALTERFGPLRWTKRRRGTGGTDANEL
jgi:hypothetical protein